MQTAGKILYTNRGTVNISESDIERFFKYTDRLTESGCWNWRGCKDKDGYGVFSVKAIPVRAHRFSHAAFNSTAENHQIVLHKCDNPSCVNPNHLMAGTTMDNIADMVSKGRGAKGEKSANAKLSKDHILEIRKKYNGRKYGSPRIGKEYGVSSTTIHNIITGKIWKHV